TFIGDYLEIQYNFWLTSLSGLNNLNSIGGDFYIMSSAAMTSLTGLDNLNSIGGDLIIGGNNEMTYISGLNNLATIGGQLSIGANYPLYSITGLNNLTSIGESLEINANYYLRSLSGLNNLASIGGKLSINSNVSLTSLTGLDNLTSIGGALIIRYNDALTSLSALDKIEAESIIGLFIENNISLATCEAESVCNYLSAPNDTIAIRNNATGCNSQEEVKSACGLSIYENRQSISLNISPNPFSTSAIIEYELTKPETVLIIFYNQFGKQVDVIEQMQAHGLNRIIWAPKNLGDGIYYFRLEAGVKMCSGKVVLMN
ncbi:MAG: hypothetical protein Q8T08_23330, partial [Ignavibacteria bacterium]|nr:hypothetical protein [Ignavibacteria bacterium]